MVSEDPIARIVEGLTFVYMVKLNNIVDIVRALTAYIISEKNIAICVVDLLYLLTLFMMLVALILKMPID